MCLAERISANRNFSRFAWNGEIYKDTFEIKDIIIFITLLTLKIVYKIIMLVRTSWLSTDLFVDRELVDAYNKDLSDDNLLSFGALRCTKGKKKRDMEMEMSTE